MQTVAALIFVFANLFVLLLKRARISAKPAAPDRPTSDPRPRERVNGTLRIAIVHHAPALSGLWLGRSRQLVGQPAEEVVELGAGLVAHVPPACAASREQLRCSRQTLERLLPPDGMRSIEFGPRALTLLVDDELAIGQQGTADRDLQALAAALAPPPARVDLAHSGGPRRCAYCHDDVDVHVTRCPGCATAVHRECSVELRRCPTAGCGGRQRLSA